jgi:hypothetical protein
MRKGLNMSAADVIAHQKKHGFAPPEEFKPSKPLDRVKLRKSREPNKTEAEFGRILQSRIGKGELGGPLRFEPIKFKVGTGCYYTPDWGCMSQIDRLWFPTFFEVKGGHIWDDSTVKWKSAVEQYPWARFEIWQKKSGEWTRIG